MEVTGRQRLDKWLWFARLVKTRVLAVRLVEAGDVRVNRLRVAKPGHDVKPGDVLTILLHGHVRVLRIRGLAPRRGASAQAVTLYEDLAQGGPAQNMDASGA